MIMPGFTIWNSMSYQTFCSTSKGQKQWLEIFTLHMHNCNIFVYKNQRAKLKSFNLIANYQG